MTNKDVNRKIKAWAAIGGDMILSEEYSNGDFQAEELLEIDQMNVFNKSSAARSSLGGSRMADKLCMCSSNNIRFKIPGHNVEAAISSTCKMRRSILQLRSELPTRAPRLENPGDFHLTFIS
jgi:hypothetical protein